MLVGISESFRGEGQRKRATPGLARLQLFLEVEAQRGRRLYKETLKKGEWGRARGKGSRQPRANGPEAGSQEGAIVAE